MERTINICCDGTDQFGRTTALQCGKPSLIEAAVEFALLSECGEPTDSDLPTALGRVGLERDCEHPGPLDILRTRDCRDADEHSVTRENFYRCRGLIGRWWRVTGKLQNDQGGQCK